MTFLRKICNRFLSPVVIALEESILYDMEMWVVSALSDKLIHASGRFMVTLDNYEVISKVKVVDEYGRSCFGLNLFDRIVLKRAVKIVLKRERARRLEQDQQEACQSITSVLSKGRTA